ncbi:hypothetical protein CYMTET_47442 [Cymbomonas tetramitiformis]|uniref:Uncharacterized protein n=1 Tax=Cymbomonas tetramitiformis TaxID=36881 RepID=A0AAE0EWL0_9CHLO|nr:hypothetical protein CYMTET_47442 [Cymbomonas tetramitiformis]
MVISAGVFYLVSGYKDPEPPAQSKQPSMANDQRAPVQSAWSGDQPTTSDVEKGASSTPLTKGHGHGAVHPADPKSLAVFPETPPSEAAAGSPDLVQTEGSPITPSRARV